MPAHERCVICEESLGRPDTETFLRQVEFGNIVEMYNPAYLFELGRRPHPFTVNGKRQDGIVHTQCGLNAGWEVS